MCKLALRKNLRRAKFIEYGCRLESNGRLAKYVHATLISRTNKLNNISLKITYLMLIVYFLI